jgi:hypothetical protein
MLFLILGAPVAMGVGSFFALKAFLPQLNPSHRAGIAVRITLILFVILAVCLFEVGLHVGV